MVNMDNMRNKLAIVGIGETDYVFRSEKGPKALVLEAVQKALDDAKMSPKEIDGVVTESYFTPFMLQHYELAYMLGFEYNFTSAIAIGGAGNVASPLVALAGIMSGQSNVVLGYYCTNWGTIKRKAYTYGDHGSSIKGSFENVYGIYGAPVHWPMRTHRYMHEYGLTTKQLGAIAVNQRRNAVLNGKGLFKKPLTMEEYENSRIVADPLRLLDFTPMHDGACAWIMTSPERAKDCPHVPVYVTGAGFSNYPMNEADIEMQGGNYIHKPHEGWALDKALKMADMTRADMDFAEIYDAFTIMLLTFVECLGFCKMGEGGAFFESGAASLEGSLPINTNGGHLSHSYLIGASHLVEAVRQLRGEAGACQVKDAKIGLVAGGAATEEISLILTRG